MIGRRVSVYLLMLIFLIITAGCGSDRILKDNKGLEINADNNAKESSIESKTEKEPISERFPKLGEFEKCYWKADIIGKESSKLTPGPTPYWMEGYVFLNSQEFETFKNNYKWTSVDGNWEPELDAEILGVKSTKWSYSEEFNNFIKPPSFFGKFCLDIEQGVIYFHVEK